jgi:hypothetical protein
MSIKLLHRTYQKEGTNTWVPAFAGISNLLIRQQQPTTCFPMPKHAEQ